MNFERKLAVVIFFAMIAFGLLIHQFDIDFSSGFYWGMAFEFLLLEVILADD